MASLPVIQEPMVGSFLVPAGKRLVIEYVSGLGLVPRESSGSSSVDYLKVRTSVNGQAGDYYFRMVRNLDARSNANDQSRAWVTSEQAATVFADPETPVEVWAYGSSGGADVTVTLAGHLEDIR